MTPFYEAMLEVLERPEYDILTGRTVDYQQIIMEAIGRAVISLFERINIRLPDSPEYNPEALTYVFIVVAIFMLLSASMGVTYILIKRRGRKARQDAYSAAIFDDIASNRFSLSDLLRLSKEHADKSQLREAVRYNYIAVLVALNDKQTIKVDKSKTNAQLIRDMSQAAPALLDQFTQVVDIFQQTWFGKKNIDADRYRLFSAEAEAIFKKGDYL